MSENTKKTKKRYRSLKNDIDELKKKVHVLEATMQYQAQLSEAKLSTIINMYNSFFQSCQKRFDTLERFYGAPFDISGCNCNSCKTKKAENSENVNS